MSSVDLLVKHFLGIYFLMIGLYYTSRSLGLYARMRFSHIHYGMKGSRTWWHRHVFNVFRASILGVCVTRIFFDIDAWLGVFDPLYRSPILTAGAALLLIAFSLIEYVQAYMHEDWRSGIDSQNRGHLITTGPYNRSRNPLFIGILLGQLGFFLALPSVFSLVCLMVGAIVILRQAQSEELALSEIYGNEYLDYQARVPRWF
ncbi:methyltransferase family protein [Marinobacter fonticola]|uniref:methyltransferase family protein n=1 Tax=Marinobacter fonticola TaxID=2603215 RepID=UPI0011E703AF|nr:isoprenylcysteine carboxylmethyltransferase family protein [Marinobacter fonticola]